LQEDRAERVLPRRIILVRHGESEGNVDESMYCRVPDPRIRLTSKVRPPAFAFAA
jgi:broad specificity phosphatase PhoE